jgi:uncharacterized membrane protein YeaQ/YmgE (transglycosylase-associated protein family)
VELKARRNRCFVVAVHSILVIDAARDDPGRHEKGTHVIGNIIGAIILGMLAGYLGRALLPGRQKMSFPLTIGLGIAGALVGYIIFTVVLGIGDDDKFDLLGLPGAVIGAMILLYLYERFGADKAPAVASTPAEDEAGRRERRQGREHRRRR